MQRTAIFIDAGYVYSAGGLLCINSGKRALVGCVFDKLIDHLSQVAVASSGLPLLRGYWYDGSWGSIPTFEQSLIAELSNVKLRLGHLGMVGGRVIQKGVDTILATDLMTLAQERAISTAFLVTGDEDIRPAVKAVQRLGVRVSLIGIEGRTPYEFTQGVKLVSEADENVMLDKATLQPFFSLRVPLPIEVDPNVIVTGAGIGATTKEIGRSFGRIWSQNLTPTEERVLRSHRVRIPSTVDALLMTSCRQIVGPTSKPKDLRQGFWKGMDDIHPPQPAPAPIAITPPATTPGP